MGSLRVEKILYSGANYYFESEYFNKNLILIEGDNGTGKTTFCDLIYFGLGGRVKQFRRDADKKHAEITSDTDNYVELFIKIDGSGYNIRRYIFENDITITPYSDGEADVSNDSSEKTFEPSLNSSETKILPVHRTNDSGITFSDWLLGELEINVVELFQGYRSFKINFTDLMRLIYHDQQPDPEGVFKKIDTKGNFLSDSEMLRKAIFELLVGRSFSDYYAAIAEEKKADKDKAIAKSILDEYEFLASNMRKNSEVKNKSFLQTELQEKESQLEKLQESRNSFKRNRSNKTQSNSEIDSIKSRIIKLELRNSDFGEKLVQLYDERYQLVSLKADTSREISQIQKVIHTHDQLNLFSSDSCPYCLSKVDRAAGRCVCGASIEEEQYERFFYTSQEYNQILKSKLKSLNTIAISFESCNEDISNINKSKDELNSELPYLKNRLGVILAQIDQKIDFETINDIDDMVLDVRQDIAELMQAIELESKLEKLQKSYDDKREAQRELELKRKELEVKAQRDIESKVKSFSSIYNDLMISTLSDCRSARIDSDTYMPSINDGEYREASSLVPMRFSYYLSLMQLSLKERDVAFPKFLLVDTPETAGIELDNLKNCLSKFKLLDESDIDYQVILATGLGKYPEEIKSNRVLFMPDKKHGLLSARE